MSHDYADRFAAQFTEEQIDAFEALPIGEQEFLLNKADAEESLIDFIIHWWHVVVPGRPFKRGWAIDAIVEHLEAVAKGQIRKLLMNVPPGFMKSLATDVFYPAWIWGPKNLPSTQFVCAAYTQDLTVRDNVKTRILMTHPAYQRAWGDRFSLIGDQNAKQKFMNNHMGFKIATSVHGVSTGERGDCVIIDDPHNVLEAESDAKRNTALQWFTEVMPTRVNDMDTASFICIMQRVHEADIAGHILEHDLGYTHLCIPMHFDATHPNIDNARRGWSGWRGDPRTDDGQLAFPERFSARAVAELEKDMMSWGGTYAVAGQLEQRPEPRGGGMVKIDWFEIVDEIPRGRLQSMCRGWDFASTEGGDGAGSASVKTGEWFDENGRSDICIVDVWWDRVSPGQLYEMIQATIALDGFDVFQSLPQDPGQAGKYQVDDLMEMFRGYDFEFSLESGDKEARFRPFAAQAETRARVGRKIKLLRGKWNKTYLDHVSKFPMGRYKDVPDAQSRSYGGNVRRGGGMFLIGSSTVIDATGTVN